MAFPGITVIAGAALVVLANKPTLLAAAVLVLILLKLLPVKEIVLQRQWGFHASVVKAAGEAGYAPGEARCVGPCKYRWGKNRPISASVESQSDIRLVVRTKTTGFASSLIGWLRTFSHWNKGTGYMRILLLYPVMHPVS